MNKSPDQRSQQRSVSTAIAVEYFSRAVFFAITGFVGVAAMVYPHLKTVATARSCSWALCMLAVFFARSLFGRTCIRRLRNGAQVLTLVNVEAALCALAGLGWGLSMYLFDSNATDQAFYLRIMILCATMAFVISSMAMFMRVYLAYTLPMVITAVLFFSTHDYVQTKDNLLISSLLYTAMITFAAFTVNRRIRLAMTDHLAVVSLSNNLSRAQSVGHVGSWRFNIRDDTIALSEEACRIFGFHSETSAKFDDFGKLIHPADRAAFMSAWAATLVGAPLDVEYRISVGDAVRWIRHKAEIEYTAEGKAFCAIGIAQDITDEKLAEFTIRESEERLRLAFQTVRQAWFDIDLTSGKITASPEFSHMLGYQSDEMYRNCMANWPDLVHPDDRDSTSQSVRNCIENGGPSTVEYRRKTMTGDWIWLRSVGKIIQRDGSGSALRMIGIHTDITEQKRAESLIQELAYFDQLTGLPNRTLMMDRLKHAIATSSRSAKTGALILIDLDNFKGLNEVQGYIMGDLLLRLVGQRIKHCIREGDTVSRFGSDEFVVILENLSERIQDAVSEAEAIGGKIINALGQQHLLEIGDHTCTASLGVTIFSDQSSSVDELIKRAHIAMHQSKDAGRNTLRFFDPAMQAIVIQRNQLEQELRAAVASQQFVLFYQAQLGRNDNLVGAEALVRWQHPKMGLISPDKFIPFAEEFGLIEPLGQWVMHTACRQLATWAQQAATKELVIAVNVSAVQFRNGEFVNHVVAALQSTGANPRCLKLELTESLLVTDIELIIEKMIALRNLGVHCALDDFGTGYSSFSYLSRLPLDQLKIDKSFVEHIATRSEAAAICAAIISLAHTLNLEVVAEGVETEAQHYFLNTVHKCDLFQGYFFSRPLPLAEFEVRYLQRQLFDPPVTVV